MTDALQIVSRYPRGQGNSDRRAPSRTEISRRVISRPVISRTPSNRSGLRVHRLAHKQRGVALLTVLLVAALVSIVAVAMIARQRTAISRTQQVSSVAQARAYALGAETFAREALAEDFRADQQPPRTDALDDQWARPAAPFEVDCGALQVRIQDAQRGFNINSIGLAGTNPALARLRNLLTALDIDPQFADQLKDWLDTDQDSTGAGGEDSDYLLREPGYRTADVFVTDPSEISLVGSLTTEQRNRLLAAIDVLPVPRAKINVNTAGPYAFMALVPGLPLSEAEGITATERHFEDPAQFVNAFPQFGPAIDALAVSSDYFDVRVRVDCNDSTLHLQSLVYRDPSSGATKVLRRNYGRVWFNTAGLAGAQTNSTQARRKNKDDS